MFLEQIEKFQCLKSSTTQGLSRGIFRTHVCTCHVSKNVSYSWSTLRSKRSKNRNCLISLTPAPGQGMSCCHFAILHTSGPFLKLILCYWAPVSSQSSLFWLKSSSNQSGIIQQSLRTQIALRENA